MTSKRLLKGSIRETSMGINYLDLADRFNISQNKRNQLSMLLDEPDGDIFYCAEWENKARECFDVYKEDRILFYNAFIGIVKYNSDLRRQIALN